MTKSDSQSYDENGKNSETETENHEIAQMENIQYIKRAQTTI